MLANLTPPTNDFFAIARYLVHGKPGTKPLPRRVAWVKTRNLPTDDPELAATYMTATARLSRRIRKAAYHAIISWHQAENPSPEIMQEIADATLELAGLGEHEALIMGHGDKPHPHLHMLVNLIHPGSGRAWSSSHDYRRFDDIMRKLSDVYGFHYAPSHQFNPELTDDLPSKPTKHATYAAMRGAPTNRLQWSKKQSRAFGEIISDDLSRADTWDDLMAAFEKYNLALEPKGTGYVAGNQAAYTKLSALRLTATAKDFGKRFLRPLIVPTTSRYHRAWFEMDEVEFIRVMASLGLADRAAVQKTVAKVTAEREQRIASGPLMIRLLRGLVFSAETSLRTPVRKHPSNERSSRLEGPAQSFQR